VTTTPKPILPALDIDRDLFGLPVTRPLDGDELMDEAIDGLRELVLDEWRHASDETLGHYFQEELGGAEGAIREFGYHFAVLEREDMRALAVARFDIAMKDEIKFWASQH
jgi:hypothetical protein